MNLLDRILIDAIKFYQMLQTETKEVIQCCICMDNPASLQCQHCCYVFCEPCCQKLATYKHIGRCIHCKRQRPWIKSVDPERDLSDNITKIISIPDIENPIAVERHADLVANGRNHQNIIGCRKNIVEVFIGMVIAILAGMIVAITTGVYIDILETYGFIAWLIFLLYGLVVIGAICFICFCTVVLIAPIFETTAAVDVEHVDDDDDDVDVDVE
jgi:hypothetical protein